MDLNNRWLKPNLPTFSGGSGGDPQRRELDPKQVFFHCVRFCLHFLFVLHQRPAGLWRRDS